MVIYGCLHLWTIYIFLACIANIVGDIDFYDPLRVNCEWR